MLAATPPNQTTALDAAHYVDWGAIAAGAFVAAAISSVFLAFGSAIGLSLASFSSSGSPPVIGLAVAAALWLIWVQVSSFVGGAYVAGRLRRRIGDALPHESEMRDGSHGLIVWAVGVAISAVLAGWITIAGVASQAGSMEYQVDKLLRIDTQPIARALTMAVAQRTADPSDTTYLVREIALRTGLPEADAEKRLADTVATLKAQADTARRYGILIAFLTAASLLISAAAAWWGAAAGGRHRDEGVDHSRFTRWH
jgi:hypothetical protein